MPDISIHVFLWLAAGAVAGGFVNGLAGFGTALFALGFWLQVFDPIEAVAMAVSLSVISGLQGVFIIRHETLAHPRRLTRFLAPAMLGIPIGIALLAILDPTILTLTIAGFLMIYGGYFAFSTSLPTLKRPTHLLDKLVGFLGGILGGLASLSGALPTMWCSLRTWSKTERRAILQPYNVAVLGVTASIFAVQGTYTPSVILYICAALPLTLVSAQIGISIFQRLSDTQFRKLLIWMMLFSGIGLVIRELISNAI